MGNCLYLKDPTGKEYAGGKIHGCAVHGTCTTSGGDSKIVGCMSCKQGITLEAPNFLNRWQDPLNVTNRKREPSHHFRDMLAGGAAFLLASGPSSDDLPLELLNKRGLWSLAINNMAGHRVRPQGFICTDPPMKFSHSIWLDPGVMKFIPIPKFLKSRGRSTLRKKEGTEFTKLQQTTTEAPNTWGYERRSWFQPDHTYFTETSAAWGNMDSGVLRTGLEKTGCTLLCAIRLCYYLGARVIFLVGADFKMTPEKGYSFKQGRTKEACNSNNLQLEIVNRWICELQNNGTFEKFGLRVYNCYQYSGLRAFPYVPFETAVNETKGIVEDVPDLSGWYEKTDKEEPNE